MSELKARLDSMAQQVNSLGREAAKLVEQVTRADAPTDLFSSGMLSQLRTEYSKIKTIDPDQPTYTKLINFLDGLSQPRLKQLSEAGIPFVSSLARNRVRR